MLRVNRGCLLALAAAGTLGVAAGAQAQLMVADSTGDRIMLFDAVDGSLIDADWLTDAGAVGWEFSTPKEALLVGDEIWVSDQIEDAIHRFDLDRNFLGSITTTGGLALDNLRGMGTDGSIVLLAVDGGSVTETIAMFNANGSDAGSFTTNASSPFDAEFFQGGILVSNFVSSGAVERYDATGTYLGDFATGQANPQQVVVLPDNSVMAVGSIGSSGTEGIFHYEPDGSLRVFVDTVAGGLSLPRGVAMLENGNYLIADSSGIYTAAPDGFGGFTFSLVTDQANGQNIGVLAPPVDNDLRMSVTESADPVSLNQDLTYTVQVRNGGQTTLTNVVAAVTLDGITSYVSSTNGMHDGSATGGVHTMTFSSLAPFSVDTYEIVVSPNSAGTAAATYGATVDQTDPDPSNNGGTVETVFDTLVDLSVAITDTPDPINLAGDQINYNVTVTNHGPEDATNVVLTVDLPADSSFVLTTAGTHDGSATGGTVTAMFPVIFTGFSEGVSIRVISGSNGDYVATASVSSDGADPTPDDSTASTTTTVDVSSDINVALSDLVDPMVMVGSANTYTLTVANAGPTPATDVNWSLTLPFEMDFVSSSAGTHSGGTVSGTIANMAAGGSVDITVDVTANALADAAFASASAFPTNPSDPDGSDNSAETTTRIVADTSGFASVILSDTAFPTLPTTVAPGTGGRLIESVDRPFLSPDGAKYALSVNVDGNDATDEVVLVWDGLQFVNVLQEGVTTMPDNFDLAGLIDTLLDVNDSGEVAFTTNTNATAADEIAAKVDLAGNVTVLAREDNAVPGTIVAYGTTIDSAQIDNAGNVYFSADTTDDAAFDEYLIRTADGVSATVLFQQGITIPANQDGGFMLPWEFFDVNDFSVSGDGMHTLLQGDSEDVTDFDDILAYDNSIVVQEGVIVDPVFFSPADALTPVTNSYLADNGDWYAVGDNDDGENWVLKNGTLIARDFDELHPGAGLFWDDFLSVVGDNNGNYVINGSSDDPDTTQDGVLVLNGERIIARENDPIDVNGNGIFDDDVRISTFGTQDQIITADGRLITQVLTRGSASGDLLVSFDLGLGGGGCLCETDGDDAQVDVFDLLAYLDLWFASDAAADIDGATGVDVFDLLAFLDCWFPASAGSPCP